MVDNKNETKNTDINKFRFSKITKSKLKKSTVSLIFKKLSS